MSNMLNAANVATRPAASLPPPLRLAQESVMLPEVQDMMQRLADYNLGICMPHMHNEFTGAFEELPDDLLQVEDGLEVSFEAADAVRARAERMVPVAWKWRNGVNAMSMCYSYCTPAKPKAGEDEDNGGLLHNPGHRREE
jgi:hypothetical protein